VGSLDDLLVVQQHDTRGDQLRHRRAHLPEREELSRADAALRAAESAAAQVRARLEEVLDRQRALEDEAAQVGAKASSIEAKLYDGSVVAHKELEAYQADHRSLKQRQSELEDAALEVMEEAEPIAAELEQLEAEASRARAARDEVAAQVQEGEAAVDAELAQVAAEREAAAAAVAADVLAAYEPLRTRLGGIGVAKLVGARCEGCHLEIPSAELEEVRRAPADALVTCPECGRLLSR
jgi:predicted  nucleic acid-binding Zn-ribbon protein